MTSAFACGRSVEIKRMAADQLASLCVGAVRFALQPRRSGPNSHAVL